jgi:alkylhydroperoxidase/carboxymuconolactone decarboxylase family protein YurZ
MSFQPKTTQQQAIEANQEALQKDTPEIVDYKVTMLIAVGAAMAANCEPCLNKAVPELIGAGVSFADIRQAVEMSCRKS